LQSDSNQAPDDKQSLLAAWPVPLGGANASHSHHGAKGERHHYRIVGVADQRDEFGNHVAMPAVPARGDPHLP
jgi:hypothetical protein